MAKKDTFETERILVIFVQMGLVIFVNESPRAKQDAQVIFVKPSSRAKRDVNRILVEKISLKVFESYQRSRIANKSQKSQILDFFIKNIPRHDEALRFSKRPL